MVESGGKGGGRYLVNSFAFLQNSFRISFLPFLASYYFVVVIVAPCIWFQDFPLLVASISVYIPQLHFPSRPACSIKLFVSFCIGL